ncbi:hypothetical protein HZS_561 [Henneguya salminicola]|nr:hypothetical protein HZS_561 [Henneguya salminicola]
MEKTEVTTELMDTDELNSQTFNEQKIPKINIQAIDDTLTMDSYSQYVSDSQNRVIRVLGSTYCSGLIDFKGMKFLIMDQPARANLPSFLNELKKNHVKHVFRVCTSTYSPQDLEKDGVYVYVSKFY